MGFQEEAILRNKVLVNLYDRLPSYALFDDTFISQQCLQTRIEWFKTFNKGEYSAKIDKEILKEVCEMIMYLEKDLY